MESTLLTDIRQVCKELELKLCLNEHVVQAPERYQLARERFVKDAVTALHSLATQEPANSVAS